ncbi:unknown [Beak and feather disease virus]|uniref:Uncharacterized protein n=1 Tax=Beak and feather disease virus TaxID=77856 RepID=Q9DXG1_BFDV|nr:unknown [Beak and feather disease virus]
MGGACTTFHYWLVPTHVTSRRKSTLCTAPRGVARADGPMNSLVLNFIKCAVSGGMDMTGKISSSLTTSMGGSLIARCSALWTVTHIRCQLRAPLWSLPARGSLSRAISHPRSGTRRTVTRSHCSGDSPVFGGAPVGLRWNKSGQISLPTPSIFEGPGDV